MDANKLRINFCKVVDSYVMEDVRDWIKRMLTTAVLETMKEEIEEKEKEKEKEK